MSGDRRLLIVVDDTCNARDMCTSVRQHAGGGAVEAFVVAPAHGTAATQWYVDEDAARADAMQRLRICLSCLREDGIRVSGALGDPDPVQAIAEALTRFPAEEIVFVTATRRPSRWLQPSVIDRAQETFTQITHVVMPQASPGGPNAHPRHSR